MFTPRRGEIRISEAAQGGELSLFLIYWLGMPSARQVERKFVRVSVLAEDGESLRFAILQTKWGEMAPERAVISS